MDLERARALAVRCKRLWARARRRLRCKHSHTFCYALDGARRVYGDPHGSRTCRTPGLVLEGCYLCGYVWARDTKA